MARVPAGVRRIELVELLELSEQIKQLDQRKKELVDKAKRAHADLGPDTYVYGPVVLLLTEAKKFDADAFADRYPAEQHPGYYASTVDRTAVPEGLRGKFVLLERRLEVKRAASAQRAA